MSRTRPTPDWLPWYLTRQESADLAAMSLEWIKARLADGSLPHYKFGRSVRIDRDELITFLSAQRGDK